MWSFRDDERRARRRDGLTVSRAVCRWLLLLGGLMVPAACSQSPAGSKPGTTPVPSSAPTAPSPSSAPAALEINGFNYTDLYIDSFEVNGQGGGNLYVSSKTSGGGGSVCCASWTPGTDAPLPVRIRWTRDRKRWCEQEVPIRSPVPVNPQHLGVHFFPDGHIEAEITEAPPRLKIQLDRVHPEERKASGNTVRDEQTSRCQDGY
ncbi:DUF3304 domain-containing protein [Archangium violaceum]|uniref:DUF3304 domain-containing protein n=1 Tax=Archangium violaceum TaxID=83451 RepID=UPI00194FC47B|nr:DUF3304 domain-containing protein [Archangium violaceum]QRO01443.1 DUF3304 domain-containing protein [Archangium violaceum]